MVLGIVVSIHDTPWPLSCRGSTPEGKPGLSALRRYEITPRQKILPPGAIRSDLAILRDSYRDPRNCQNEKMWRFRRQA